MAKQHNLPNIQVIRLTEDDLTHIIKQCINEAIILENRESKSIKQTEKVIISIFQNKLGDRLFQTATDGNGKPILTQNGNEQTLLQYLERHVRISFFHNDYANIKFEPGIARIAYGELGLQGNEDSQSLNKLAIILKIISQEHSNEFDATLNGYSFDDLEYEYGEDASKLSKEDQDEINNKTYTRNTDYTIVKINSFEEAEKFYQYTNPKQQWCITRDKNMFLKYTGYGTNSLYFAYKKGFENIEPIPDENAPLDEYGLSLLCIIMAPDYGDGPSIAYCTSRWNHDNGGSDSVLNPQQLSNLLGANIFKLCPSVQKIINIDGDLGLPSGTIWMTKNVGAPSIQEPGKYYAFRIKNGKYRDEITKYDFNDDNYQHLMKQDWLTSELDDYSYLPTKSQFEELLKYCSYQFTYYKGMNGGLFTSKKNGNSIFLPAAGVSFGLVDGRYPTSEYNQVGEYWSCDDRKGTSPYYLIFDKDDCEIHLHNNPDYNGFMYIGKQLRGVYQ